MRILISAFACEPNRGSEPGVGWGVVQGASERHQVWVLTDAENRATIESAQSTAQFVYVDLPQRLKRMLGTSAVGWNVRYVLWQWQAFWKARQLHARVGFEVVHHATYVNSWLPTFIGWLGPPLVWNAGVRERTPRAFMAMLSRRSQWFELVRNAGMTLLSELTWLISGSRAAVILSGSPKRMWNSGAPLREFFPNALSDQNLAELAVLPVRSEGPFRMASFGRLVGWKGYGLAMQAFARLLQVKPDSEYWLIGDGPEREELGRLADELGCAESVRFLGWLPREEAHQALASVDIVVHPALHDGFATVLLEAMAAGRPAICLNLGGNAAISSGGGVLLQAEHPAQVIDDLTSACLALAGDQAERIRLGVRGRRWVQERWSWAAVSQRIDLFYRDAVASRGTGAAPIEAPARS
jgi:glycosyltransferase involved in cell wall biosynthesis